MFLRFAEMTREIFEEFERTCQTVVKNGSFRISFALLRFTLFCRTGFLSPARVGGVRADKCKSIFESKQSADKKQLLPELDQSCWRGGLLFIKKKKKKKL